MDISSGDISALVFRRVVREDTAEYSFDAQMLTLFMELDGKKSLAVISRKTGQKMSSLREAAGKLLKLKLIEQVAEAITAVDAEFMDFLKRELSLAIGRHGQNVRLAAKLTGWRVDIHKIEEELPFEEQVARAVEHLAAIGAKTKAATGAKSLS